ncbi:MAG: hypothetical protein AAF998_09320 [Bacteroidota bacterium]
MKSNDPFFSDKEQRFYNATTKRQLLEICKSLARLLKDEEPDNAQVIAYLETERKTLKENGII